jgi:hypothetical protein
MAVLVRFGMQRLSHGRYDKKRHQGKDATGGHRGARAASFHEFL